MRTAVILENLKFPYGKLLGAICPSFGAVRELLTSPSLFEEHHFSQKSDCANSSNFFKNQTAVLL